MIMKDVHFRLYRSWRRCCWTLLQRQSGQFGKEPRLDKQLKWRWSTFWGNVSHNMFLWFLKESQLGGCNQVESIFITFFSIQQLKMLDFCSWRDFFQCCATEQCVCSTVAEKKFITSVEKSCNRAAWLCTTHSKRAWNAKSTKIDEQNSFWH